MPSVGVTKVASALNLDKRRVQQLVAEGVLPRAVRGQYDPVKCMLCYVRYLQKVLERKGILILDGGLDGGFVGERGEQVERLRLLRAHADLREMELARQRAAFVALRDVDAATADLVRITTARIMARPAQLAPE